MSKLDQTVARRRDLPNGRRATEEDDGLASVIAEIRGLLRASGAFLTMIPTGSQPEIIYQDSDAARFGREMLLGISHSSSAEIEAGTVLWRTGPPGSDLTLLLLPVERTGNHSKLVVGLLLDRPDEHTRLNAERIYRERRPFAVGYFHLWQRSRLLEQRAASFEAVLDQTAIGVLLLDKSSAVIYSNEVARETLSRGDALMLNKGRLRAARASDSINLQAALSHILGSDPSAAARSLKHPLVAFGRASAQPLVAAFVPSANSLIEPTDVAATIYSGGSGAEHYRHVSACVQAIQTLAGRD